MRWYRSKFDSAINFPLGALLVSQPLLFATQYNYN